MEKTFDMYDAMIRFYFREDPDTLNDLEYTRRAKEILWLKEEGLIKAYKQEK
jgi:hypothetical protein